MFQVFKDKVASIIQRSGSSKYDFDDISIESVYDDESKNEDEKYVQSQIRSKKGLRLSIFDSMNKFSSKTRNLNNNDLSHSIKNNIPFSHDSILSPGKRKRDGKTKFDSNINNNNTITNVVITDENLANELINDDSRFDTVRTQSNKACRFKNDDPPDLVKIDANTFRIDNEILFSVDALFSKVRHNHYDLVKSILENKTAHNDDFNKICVDSNGNTLLHICCQNNLKKMAILLMQSGAFVNQKNKKGLTALDYCDMYQFHALGDYIIQHGGDTGVQVNKSSIKLR